MSAVAEARRRPAPIPATTPKATAGRVPKPSGDGKADPVWVAMMDGLSTYVRDHERLYRMLAR